METSNILMEEENKLRIRSTTLNPSAAITEFQIKAALLQLFLTNCRHKILI